MSGFPWRGARFAEYRNTGPGAGTGVDRPQLTDEQARQHTKAAYLSGWNPA
jgi:pectate lyase